MTQARTNLGFNTNYTYTNDGYLQDVTIRQSDQTVDALRSRRANDELGRVKAETIGDGPRLILQKSGFSPSQQ